MNRLGRSRPPLTDDELFECWKLYQDHVARGGTMMTAAAEIGISTSAFQQRITLYRDKAGIKIQRRVPRAVSSDDLKWATSTLEKSIQGQLDRYFGILLARIDTLEAEVKKNRPVVREFTPSHRRVADGGLNVNQQRKAFKRKMAS